MHELAYAEAILGVALDAAEEQHVHRIQVHLGELHAIVPESLEFTFQLVAMDTVATGASLQVTIVPGDDFTVDGVELDDGWRYRPGAEPMSVPAHDHAHTAMPS